MNSNNTPALLRSLIIYAMCVPLAIWIGFTLANPFDFATFSYAGIFALLLVAPILLRWHHFLLIVTWNLGITIFFLPGRPPVWLLFTALSLGISLLQRTINERSRFLSAPSLSLPLFFFLAVLFFTAKLTGGIGLHSLGSQVSGGKKYITLFFAILGYFALTARRIPPKHARLCISLYFLLGFTHVVGDLYGHVPSALNIIFAFFPASGYGVESAPGMTDFHARYAGLGGAGSTGAFWMLAMYGLRGILLSGKPWRWALFGLFLLMAPLGGFRAGVIGLGLTMVFLFYIERLHRTNVMPFFIIAGLLAITVIIPFSDKLPYNFQRALSFLPLKVAPEVRQDADASSNWRLEIWRNEFPKVPQYLLLGRGYALTAEELAQSSSQAFGATSSFHESEGATGNFHNGVLSVLIPLGIWGAIALLWFWFASLRALYDNYRYGDPAFKTINTFFFVSYVVSIIFFLFIFGAIEGDLSNFVVIAGLSVSLNGGIRRPAPAPARVVDKHSDAPLARPRFQPFYPR
jgi:hypothetical protein